MRITQFIYNIARPLGGLRLARYLSRYHPRILMYHRINPPGSNDGINADIFREQMKLIKKSFSVMSLSDICKYKEYGETPENAVVITFDDGYYDFYKYAFPIISDLDLPVTLFITTGFVNGDLWLWPDHIKYALINSKVNSIELPGIPETLNISDDYDKSWHKISDHCVLLDDIKKKSLINLLYERLNVDFPKEVPDAFRGLSWCQIRSMMNSGLDIGSHSYSHPILTKISEEELVKELRLSKKMITDQLSQEPKFFCYPNGRSIDFNYKIQSLARQAGYSYGVAAYPSCNPLADRWAINRYAAHSQDDMFKKTLFGLSYLREKSSFKI